MSGISYIGMVGYWAAMQQPPHLTCIMSYEALIDLYQGIRKGGVYPSNFHEHWYRNIVVPNSREPANTGEAYIEISENAEYRDQTPWSVFDKCRDPKKIAVPMYTAGNWTDSELHLPGNILAYNHASSKYKWLEMHTGNHLGAYYELDHVQQQKQFLDYFLMDKKDNGMLEVPPIRLCIRQEAGNFFREEQAFPPPDVSNVAFYFTADNELSETEPSQAEAKAFEYEKLSGRLTFESDPLTQKIEILGTPYLELSVATEAEDLDLLIYLRNLSATDGIRPIIIPGNHDEPTTSFCRGFWRLSHRDEYVDFHHTGIPRPAAVPRSEGTQGEVYRVMVPLLPTSWVLEKGSRLQIELGSADEKGTIPPMRHEGGDRTKARFAGKNVLYSGGRIVVPTVAR